MTAKLFAASAMSLLFATVARAVDSGPIVIGVPVGVSGANSIVAPSVVQEAQLHHEPPFGALERSSHRRVAEHVNCHRTLLKCC
jgi:hypothetical protein